jgi:hypothetical protein
MLPVPENSEARDVVRWLTSVFLVGRDAKVPYQFITVSPDGRVVHAIPCHDTRAVDASHLNVRDCYAHWPRLGAFNVSAQNYAVHIERQTVREWSRSLNRTMIRVRKVDLLPGRPYLPADSFVAVPYTYSPFLSPTDALRSILDGSRESSAINRRVVVGRSLCTYKVGVFLDGELCGTASEGAIMLTTPNAIDVITKTFGETHVVRENLS